MLSSTACCGLLAEQLNQEVLHLTPVDFVSQQAARGDAGPQRHAHAGIAAVGRYQPYRPGPNFVPGAY